MDRDTYEPSPRERRASDRGLLWIVAFLVAVAATAITGFKALIEVLGRIIGD